MDNISDHSVISVSFDISVEYAHMVVQNEAKLLWTSATAADIDAYKHNIDRALDSITLDPDFLYCTDHKCSVHMDAIASLYDSIVMCCLDAGKCIPTKKFVNKKCNKAIPGWKEHVDPYRSDALFWHAIWKDIGSPTSGHVADIRRRTRYKYHNALRKVKRHEEQIRALRMAQNIEGPLSPVRPLTHSV